MLYLGLMQNIDRYDVIMANTINKLEVKHIAYSAQRTLRNATLSDFKTSNYNGLQLLIDKNIGFANQIWGVNEQTIFHLPKALGVYEALSMAPELDIINSNLTAETITKLTSFGFEKTEELNFLSTNMQSYTPINPVVKVTRLHNNNAEMFLKLLETSGMKTTQEIWQLKKHLYCTDTFRCFVAVHNNKPCALATSFVDGDFALLANAYTHTDFQNKGCQMALLQARLNDAKQLGLKQLIVDVEPNTTSERNCVRAGFKPLNSRSIWQKKAQYKY